MPNKMLIDTSHPEETRVVVVRGNRIEEFDFESQDKKQLRGNIYLARVTRVEPSLQAAFVEYGGNRHGFLAFSEIHPDYYQIPLADRQAILRAEAAQARADEEDEEDERRDRGGRRRGRGRDRAERPPRKRDDAADVSAASQGDGDSLVEVDELDEVETMGEATGSYEDRADAPHEGIDDGSASAPESAAGGTPSVDGDGPAEDDQGPDSPRSIAAAVDGDVVSEPVAEKPQEDDARSGGVEEVPAPGAEDHEVESVGAEDALEEMRSRRKPMRRQYKIQEVIKRRQILLVQVVKEERGNKGAALTTYMSLAGRYSVLMPNTARGGGISRKITSAVDRKRLKDVVRELDVPEGMGVILRTAGENRTKAEIKRDYEYLMRLWETVRNLTLQSTAPALVYEEGSLIKRSVRDLYNKDIDEILVSGDDGYREAKDFMRMLMPSHAKVVQPYRDTTPIFARNGIEAQLDRMLQPQVTLKSGGYIIINQTEALVAIDVNSGRSTKEHSIEDTALQTNLEAAEEVARQLRLRDLAGLIVIDFIDMEENRNNRSVEKRLKDHLKNDRARIQVGRISHFGLMEMSRQRIRASVLESTMKPCPHCGGTGHIRSDSSVALLVVRAIEEFLMKDSRSHIVVRAPSITALYILNHKRGTLVDMERRFGVTITIEADETLGAQHYSILRGALAEKPADFAEPVSLPLPPDDDPDVVDEIDDEEEAEPENARIGEEAGGRSGRDDQHADGDQNRDRKRRRRRRRRGGRDRDEARPQNGQSSAGSDGDAAPQRSSAHDEDGDNDSEADDGPGDASGEVVTESGGLEGERKKRRRGRRGGKRNRRDDEAEFGAADGQPAVKADDADGEAPAAIETGPHAEVAAPDEPVELLEQPAAAPAPEKPRRASRARRTESVAATAPAPSDDSPKVTAPKEEVEVDAPVATAVAAPAEEQEPPSAPARSAPPAPEEPADSKPKKGGWWQRSKSFF